MAKPIVAIVGRPNVGKSTLFNKIVGQRLSIVEDTPGVTRDRIFGDAEWCGRKFSLVDTGGIEPASKDVILTQMREQAQIAIDSSERHHPRHGHPHRRHRHRRGRGQHPAEKRGAGGAVRQQVRHRGRAPGGVLRVLQPGPGRPGDGVLGPRPRHRRLAGRVSATSCPRTWRTTTRTTSSRWPSSASPTWASPPW